MDSIKQAEKIVGALRAAGKEPDREFVSASGGDHGTVEAWAINEDKREVGGDITPRVVVAYGNNAQTHYDYADGDDIDALDMASWLLTDGVGSSPLERAAVLGPDAIEAVYPDYDGEVKVIAVHHYFGPTIKARCLCDDGCYSSDWDSSTSWDNAALALAEIERYCPADEVYRLGHNESDRPQYFVVAA